MTRDEYEREVLRRNPEFRQAAAAFMDEWILGPLLRRERGSPIQGPTAVAPSGLAVPLGSFLDDLAAIQRRWPTWSPFRPSGTKPRVTVERIAQPQLRTPLMEARERVAATSRVGAVN